ncbi:MAG TPA: tRNA uridine-5-carboxymethylaminomethyl(34) synthesis GTPase MnmE [Candidatus Binataceae bacterium]|nr:tRNA uridine-5-carboxymethylaminomethyl(34) synthesis GTPase MnmE [Candidatus Binataceae bacterium]
MYVEDTIVAPATAPGPGAVAIVRLSGPDAHRIARALWHPLKQSAAGPSCPPPSRLQLGELCDPGRGVTIDRAMAVFFAAPRTLTGEPVAELHCHGGSYLVRRVIGLAIAAGARGAEAGEFTRRAFLNGRIDLTAAEAIRDLVEARGERALAQAVAQLGGALATRVTGLRAQVISIRAHLEAAIDFADEDLSLPSAPQIATSIAALAADVALLHDSFERGRIARDGLRAAIVGRPNVGKSSLLNLMLGSERAIVTPIPGTTRDVIEDSLELGGYALRLQDTAGVRDSADQVERIGIERALARAREADLLIAVFDSSAALNGEDFQVAALTAGRSAVALLNKCDRPAQIAERDLRAHGVAGPIIRFSALEAIGLDDLRREILAQIEASTGDGGDDVAISRERHREALARALEALGRAQTDTLTGMPPEIVAVEMTTAAEALGALTGEVGAEDVLELIFREFCIGK